MMLTYNSAKKNYHSKNLMFFQENVFEKGSSLSHRPRRFHISNIVWDIILTSATSNEKLFLAISNLGRVACKLFILFVSYFETRDLFIIAWSTNLINCHYAFDVANGMMNNFLRYRIWKWL